MSTSSSSTSSKFEDQYKELKDIEKKDSVLTGKHQIDRLTRSGSKYFNLNPYEVLQIGSEASVAEIKTKYKRLSFIVHPDKNIEDKERAQLAFEAVSKAWKELENDVTRQKCLDLYEEARQKLDLALAAKRKQLKKEGKSDILPEDTDPENYKHSQYVMVMKLFAESYKKREQIVLRNQEIRKRQREQEIDEERMAVEEKEYQKNFEESRQERVSSWQSFQMNKSKKKKKSSLFDPPKVKAESRR